MKIELSKGNVGRISGVSEIQSRLEGRREVKGGER